MNKRSRSKESVDRQNAKTNPLRSTGNIHDSNSKTNPLRSTDN